MGLWGFGVGNLLRCGLPRHVWEDPALTLGVFPRNALSHPVSGFSLLGFFSSGSYSGAGHTFVPRHGRPSEVSRISKVGHTQSPTAHVVNSLQLGNPLSKVYGL